VVAGRADCDALTAKGQVDWYLFGVLTTCRWVAGAGIRYDAPIDGRHGESAKAPLTLKSASAIEELIEEETIFAERLVGRWEWPGRPGYLEGVFATFAWTWRRSDAPPLEVEQAHAS
jgi:hypothetical protein